jgi:putative ATPase
MMELDTRTPEVLTFSKGGGARDRWLERAVSRTSEQLAAIRDELFSPLVIARHHLLLDLRAGEGLLTWEALRRVPEGGVWTLCDDPTAAALLESRAQALAELERPAILVGELKALPELLRKRDQETMWFDAAVGRNALFREADKAGCLGGLSGVMRQGGRISLAEVVPSMGMRLSQLLKLEGESAAFRRKVAKSEERIYKDPDNPLVNWSVEDFCGMVEDAGFGILERHTRRFTERRTVRAEDIERWFSSQSGSYAALAAGTLDSEGLERLRKISAERLTGQEVDWQSTVLFISAETSKQ